MKMFVGFTFLPYAGSPFQIWLEDVENNSLVDTSPNFYQRFTMIMTVLLLVKMSYLLTTDDEDDDNDDGYDDKCMKVACYCC